MQLHFTDGLFGCRQQDRGEQADRRHRRRGIDAAHDAAAQLVDDVGNPLRLVVSFTHLAAPIGFALLQYGLDTDRLAYVHVHLAEVFTQGLDRPDQAQQGLFLLLRSAQLADERIALDEFLVAEVYGNESQRPARQRCRAG